MVVLAAVATASQEGIRQALVLIDRDGSRHFLQPDQIHLLRVGVWLGLITLLAAAGGLLTFRMSVVAVLSNLEADVRAFGMWLRSELRLPSRGHALALVAIVLIGAALRVTGLDHPMRFDESDSFLHTVLTDWFNVWTDYTVPNNHIFYNLLAHFSVLTLGETATAARLPTLLAGIAIIPVLFFVGRVLFGTHAGLLAAALASGLPALVDYSTNARGYMLVTLLFLLSIMPTVMLQQRRSITAWGVIAVLMTAGLFTVPTMLFAFGTVLLMVWLGATPERRKPLIFESIGVVALCGFASIVLYLPPAMRCTWGAIVSNRYVQPMTLDRAVSQVSKSLNFASTTSMEPALLLWAIGLAMSLIIATRLPAGRRLLVALIIPAAAICVAGRFIPPPRVLLYMLPIIALLSAAGLVHLIAQVVKSRSAGVYSWIAAAGSLFLAVQLIATRNTNPSFEQRFYQQIEGAANSLAPSVKSSSLIIAPVPINHPLQYELLRLGQTRRAVIDPRHLRRGRSLEDRNKVWIVRTHPEIESDRWQLNTGRFDLTRSALSEFTAPRLVRSTEFLQIWVADRR